MKGLGRNTRFKKPHGYSGGGNPRNRKNYANKGATEIGQEAQSYKEYVKTMFGGGDTLRKPKKAKKSAAREPQPPRKLKELQPPRIPKGLQSLRKVSKDIPIPFEIGSAVAGKKAQKKLRKPKKD